MGRTVNFDEIPDSTLLPQDMYQLDVEGLVETKSKAGNMMYKATFRVAEGPFEGTPIFDYFTIGNTNDPEAVKQETWNEAPGSKRLKRLLKAVMVPFTGDIDQMIEKAVGQRFIGAVEQRTDSNPTDPKYAGVKKNSITAFHPIGTRPTSSAVAGNKPASVAPAVPVSPTVPCPYCGTTMARSAYSAHVKTMHPDEA